VKAARTIFHVIICIALIFLLCLCALSLTGHMQVDFATMQEALSLRRENPLWILLGTALLAAADLLLVWLLSRLRHGLLISILISAIIIMLFGTIWQSGYHFEAVADQRAVWETAKAITQHIEKDEWLQYIAAYPQQKGLVNIFAALIRMFGEEGGLKAFRILCLFGSVSVTVFGSLLAYSLSGRKEAGIAASVLLMECSPLELYTVFLYGTIPSLSFTVIAFYCACQLVKTRKYWILIPLAASSAAMVMLYSSTVIAAIAIALTLLLAALDKQKKYGSWNKDTAVILCGAVLPILMVFCVNISNSYLFEQSTGVSTKEDSMPASCWVMMGVSSDGVLGPGGYDGTSIALFESFGRDEERTDRAAKEQIQAALSDYAHGRRSLLFFVDKTRIQWTDPWFNSLTMTIYSSAPAALDTLFFFFAHNRIAYFESFLSLLMCIVYLFAALELFFLLRRKEVHIEAMLLPIYFAGGFVFQFFWEAKGRYCFPYYICLLILAGVGMADLIFGKKDMKAAEMKNNSMAKMAL
jgi:hypothetical protein